jgi:hypothetical protein
MLSDIFACIITAFFLRIVVLAFFPSIHKVGSVYWNFSGLVGVVGILGFIFTSGLYVSQNFNIGTAIGFFMLDIYGSMSPSLLFTKRKTA